MKNFLSSHYQFRYNHLREATEWRSASKDDTAWRELDSWALNSIYCEVCAAGVKVRFADLRRLLSSNYCESFHFNRTKKSGLLPPVEINGRTLIEAIV